MIISVSAVGTFILKAIIWLFLSLVAGAICFAPVNDTKAGGGSAFIFVIIEALLIDFIFIHYIVWVH